jgi:uncharacterized membrane protein
MILAICIISLIGISVIVWCIILGISFNDTGRDSTFWFILLLLVISLAGFVFSIVSFIDGLSETYLVTTPEGTYEITINENETDIKSAIFEKEGVTYVEVK